MPRASVEESDNSLDSKATTEEKREPKDVFRDLQVVINELDSKIKMDKSSAKPSMESEDAVPTLGEMIGMQER